MIDHPDECIKFLMQQARSKVFEVVEHKKKRSLNSNSYCWALLGEIAKATGDKAENIYLKMLEDYAPSLLIPVPKGKKPNGFFKYYRFRESHPINGKDADWYVVFKGSSGFNQSEMSFFIDKIIEEAKDLDIDVLPSDEIQRLKDKWNDP